MEEGNNINEFELNKTLRKISKIYKEKFTDIQDRSNRQLKIKVKKYIKKVESNDDGLL